MILSPASDFGVSSLALPPIEPLTHGGDGPALEIDLGPFEPGRLATAQTAEGPRSRRRGDASRPGGLWGVAPAQPPRSSCGSAMTTPRNS